MPNQANESVLPAKLVNLFYGALTAYGVVLLACSRLQVEQGGEGSDHWLSDFDNTGLKGTS